MDEQVKALPERFWDKVYPEPNSGCWLWGGGDNAVGYGRFWDGQRVIYAHRYAYEHVVGPIPEGLVIDHLCRTPCCVNPGHMEPVTKKENLVRAPAIKERVESPTCINGHPWNDANTHVSKWGRRCRVCRREGMRDRYRTRAAVNA